MTMVPAYRRSMIANPLIALIMVPAAAMIGLAVVAGQPALMWEGLERLALDAGLVISLGALVVIVKQYGRRRLSRELHDQLGQSLSALRPQMAALSTIALSPIERPRRGSQLDTACYD